MKAFFPELITRGGTTESLHQGPKETSLMLKARQTKHQNLSKKQWGDPIKMFYDENIRNNVKEEGHTRK